MKHWNQVLKNSSEQKSHFNPDIYHYGFGAFFFWETSSPAMTRRVLMRAANAHLWAIFSLILHIRRPEKAKEKKGIFLCLTMYAMTQTVKWTEACITPALSFTAAVAAMPPGGKLHQNQSTWQQQWLNLKPLDIAVQRPNETSLNLSKDFHHLL